MPGKPPPGRESVGPSTLELAMLLAAFGAAFAFLLIIAFSLETHGGQGTQIGEHSDGT